MRVRHLIGTLTVLSAALTAACTAPPAAQDVPLPTILVLPSETPSPLPTPTPPAPIIVGTLDYDVPRDGQLMAGQPIILEFSGERGAPIRIRARADAAIQLVLSAPDGQAVADGTEIDAVLIQTGIYRLTLLGDADIAYTVGLTRTDRTAAVLPTLTPIPVVVGVPTPTPYLSDVGTFVAELSHDETAPGEFATNGEPQVYTFVAREGQYARVNLTPVTGDHTLRVTLLGPRGEALATDSLSAEIGAELRAVRLTETGSYGLRLQSDGMPGTYALWLRLYDSLPPLTPTVDSPQPTLQSTPILTPTIEPAERGVRLSPDTPVEARLRTGSVNTHAFFARQGETITLSVRPLDGESLVPRIELVDPEGNAVAEVIGNRSQVDRDAVISGFITALEGPYTIFVTAEADTSGRYQVAFGYGSTSSMTQRGTVQSDQPVGAQISQRATGDSWFVDLRAGDILTVTVLPQDNSIVPVLEVVHSDGTLLAIDAASGGLRTPRISGVRILKDGIHSFRVRPAQADLVGVYTLVWQYLNIAPTATPAPGIIPILTVFDALPPNEYAFFPFYGESGSSVRALAAATMGSALDPVIALIAPDGTTIAEADDTFNALDALIEVTLPVDGTYQVRVGGYLSSGPFRVEVEQVFRD